MRRRLEDAPPPVAIGIRRAEPGGRESTGAVDPQPPTEEYHSWMMHEAVACHSVDNVNVLLENGHSEQ